MPNVINGCNRYLDADGDRLNDCEERVLGTQGCVGDTDADGIPDLVEALSGTNPLVPEDLLDSDRDGQTNIDEVLAHTDPQSVDPPSRWTMATATRSTPADPTPDGRACYHVRIANVGLVQTLARPNPPFEDIKAGTNDIYLYMLSGRDNDPRGAGVSSLDVPQVRLLSRTAREPSGDLPLEPGDFVLGL